jgi:predicted Ser/Thr protein kinase
MAPILTHPDEAAILPVAAGDPAEGPLAEHLEGCPGCRERVERLRTELAALRLDLDGGMTPPSNERDPALSPIGKPSSGGTTLNWASSSLETAAPGPIGPAALAAARDRAEASAEIPGAIGRYLVVDRLGFGAQGEVFRVVHPKLGKNLVVKWSWEPVRADERPALVDEGRLLVDLVHPNLVKVEDLDFHDNRPFLVMEYVPGRNLEQYAREEPVTPRRAAAIVGKLARALAVAHPRGIIHRDLKPRNILIDEAGEPRLIDFGLARLRHAWSDRPDAIWGGTLPFMAPEQARREHERTGPRSDVFGLGGGALLPPDRSAAVRGSDHG